MKRQLGVWITIICILVVGVSVTKMTRRFVTSGTLETFAAETTVVFEPSAMARTATGAAGAPEAGAESPRSRQAETELFSAAAETAAEAKVSEAPEEEMAAEDMAVITEASEVTPEQEALTSETVKSPLVSGAGTGIFASHGGGRRRGGIKSIGEFQGTAGFDGGTDREIKGSRQLFGTGGR